MPDFRFLSSASALASHYSAYLFFLSTFLPASASQLASSVLPFRSRFPDLSPYSRPGFPCHLSGSVYSASCLFPFVLPSFAPTAVPLVLPFWISPRGSTLDFRFLSSASALASHYSASVSSFPCFPLPPHSWVSRCATVPFVPVAFPFRSACFHASLPVLVLSLPAIPFSASLFRVTGATLSYRPPVSSSAAPLSFRFRFRLLGLSFWIFYTRIDLAYITTLIQKCQHLFCAFLNYYVALSNQLILYSFILVSFRKFLATLHLYEIDVWTKQGCGKKITLQSGKSILLSGKPKRREQL